jgi:hypothetical protein
VSETTGAIAAAVGSLNLELVKRYVAYVLLPPLITLALGLLGAWVVSSFERKGA